MKALTVMDTSIEALVEEAKRGSRPAFDRLVVAYRDRLENFIHARLGPALKATIEAQDVLQEAFLRAFCAIGRVEWRDEESFFSWLGGIAEHVIRRAAERKRRTEFLNRPGELPASQVPPSKALRRQERFERLRDSLEMLSPEHREVILLARIERLSFKEISERMSRSPDAVRKLLLRALKNLKSSFGETESLHLPEQSLGKEEGHVDG
jgi:RNA polymerase sigma factor (sigma-70 family)